MSRQAIARAGVPFIIVVAAVVAWKANIPEPGKPLPAVALNSEFILRIEHGFVAFVVLLFLLVVLVKAVWEGELPAEIGREGAKYATADRAEKGLETLKTVSDRRWELISRLSVSHQERLKDLQERVGRLEGK